MKKPPKGGGAGDRRLIEEWLPIGELSIEGPRERTSMTPFPAPNRLHVWWARRPLVASRAAVLGSLLPAGAERERFLRVLGIHGDPVAARRKIDEETRTGPRRAADSTAAPSWPPSTLSNPAHGQPLLRHPAPPLLGGPLMRIEEGAATTGSPAPLLAHSKAIGINRDP